MEANQSTWSHTPEDWSLSTTMWTTQITQINKIVQLLGFHGSYSEDSVFWNVLLCIVGIYWSFRGIYCLHHQCRMTCITNGGSSFLWKVGTLTRLHVITLYNILFLILKSTHVIETGDWKWLLESNWKITTIHAIQNTVQLWVYCQEYAPLLMFYVK